MQDTEALRQFFIYVMNGFVDITIKSFNGTAEKSVYY